MKKGLKFTRKQLYDLYWNQKLSLSQIAVRYNCNGTNILYWLKKFKIKRRSPDYRKVSIPKEVLEDLYWKKNLSSLEIGKKFNINSKTVRKKLEKFGIPRKTLSQAGTKKFKASFSGNLKEKAYFLGLRAGDFYAKQVRKCIRIQTTTTHQAQVELLKNSFKKYGELRKYLSRSKRRADEWFIYVDLNSSFEFLLDKPKKIPKWILENDDYFYNFLAAYMDCEGTWKVLRSHRKSIRFMFKIRTGDLNILKNIKNKLKADNFHVNFYLEKRKGQQSPSGKYNFNIYDLTIYQKENIFRLVNKLLSLSKHSEKIRKMEFIIKNKSNEWSNVESSWNRLRKEIKGEILSTK